MTRGVALIACAAALALPGALAGCSSDPAATAAPAAEDRNPANPSPEDRTTAGPSSAPVRVGVTEFVTLVGSPDVQVVDVRTPEEFAGGHIAGAVNIPVQDADFAARVAELDPNVTYAVYCRSGNRSQPAVADMHGAGFRTIYELGSGTIGWASDGQPLVR